MDIDLGDIAFIDLLSGIVIVTIEDKISGSGIVCFKGQVLKSSCKNLPIKRDSMVTFEEHMVIDVLKRKKKNAIR